MDLKEKVCTLLGVPLTISNAGIENGMSIRLTLTARGDVKEPIPEGLIEVYDEYAMQEGLKTTSILLKEAGVLDKSLETKEETEDYLSSPFIDDSFYKGVVQKKEPATTDFFDAKIVEKNEEDEFIQRIKPEFKEERLKEENIFDLSHIKKDEKTLNDKQDVLRQKYNTISQGEYRTPRASSHKKLHHKSLFGRTVDFVNSKKGKITIVFVGGTVVVGVGIFSFIDNMLDNHKKTNLNPQSNIEQRNTEYNFKYTVKAGDTLSGLKYRFDATHIETGRNDSSIYMNEVITIYTYNKEIAKQGQEMYEEEQQENEPTSFEEYTVQEGDTLPEIADKFGVTCDDIMRYNDQIKDIRTIYAGDTYKIPQWDKTNVKK